MSSHSEEYPEEADRTGKEPPGGDRPDRPHGRPDDRRVSPVSAWSWGGASGLWPWASRGAGGGEPGSDGPRDRDAPAGRIARVRDEGLIALLVVVGAVLFLIPEPATSALGVLLVALGALAWLVDRAL